MEIPTSNTPVAKCLDLAAYASQTIGAFTPSSPELQELAGKMDVARQGLALAEAACAKAENDMIPVRVDVTLADYAADGGIKQSKRAAEMADGEANGPFQNFLDVYAEVANRIRALFPRNKKKQDLFFDAVSNRPAMNRNAEDATP